MNTEDFKIVPFPPHGETPRQFLLRITGKDHTWLKEYDWGDLKDNMMQEINLIAQGSSLPLMLYEVSQNAIMDTPERDTHFQNFAKLEVDDIQVMGFTNRVELETYLAQRAYDLVWHLLTKSTPRDLNMAPYFMEEEEAYIATIQKHIARLPDVKEWPHASTSNPPNKESGGNC